LMVRVSSWLGCRALDEGGCARLSFMLRPAVW